MNRFINVLLLIILLNSMLVGIYVGFDLPVFFLKTNGANIPYRDMIFTSLGILIFIINARRSIHRWKGIYITSKQKKFKWNKPISLNRKNRIKLYTIIEVSIIIFISFSLFLITSQAWLISLAYLVGALDNLIFTTNGIKNNKFRVGISSKALIIADREVTILYFKGLRKISIQQNSIYFDYIKELQLSFPYDCIDIENRNAFFNALQEEIDSDSVFISKKRT